MENQPLTEKLRAQWAEKSGPELLRILHNLQVSLIFLEDTGLSAGAEAVRAHIVLVGELIVASQEGKQS